MTEDEFNKLEKLCRLSLSPEERKKFLASLDRVLSYVQQLDEIPTEGVSPCLTVLESVSNVMREDLPCDYLVRDIFLSNAPAHTGGMVRVPPVLKQEV